MPTLRDAVSAAFEKNVLVKCTLSKPTRNAAAGLKNIYIRPVQIKSGLKLAFNYRYDTRDEVKNHDLNAALDLLEALAATQFDNADLFTTEADSHWQKQKNGVTAFTQNKAAQTEKPDTAHNREKHRLLDVAAPWLQHLGITNAKGEVLAAAQDKWKQINKYLEIIGNLLEKHPLNAGAHIADMGAGKGYLTFALYDYLKNHKGIDLKITGIELRPALVEFCNKTAQNVDFQGLIFEAQDINTYRPERLDMLIALHACDIATDMAIAAGLREQAGIIIVAPCCHKQIRKEMAAQNELAPVLQHGILEERQAEIITDGIRALLMESKGYKTAVFEFISTEHTAKNVMITAVKSAKKQPEKRRDAILKQIAALKGGFGIQEHYLEKLMA